MSHTPMQKNGAALLYAAALAGEPMDKFFNSLLAAGDPIGREVLAGAIGAALTLVDKGRANGGYFTTDSNSPICRRITDQSTAATAIEFSRALTTNDVDYLSAGLSALASMLTSIQPKLTASTKVEPREVRVLSMPDRKASTEVERDARGEIERTVRIERDAA